MQRTNIPLRDTGFFVNLVHDLVEGRKEIRSFRRLPHETGSYGLKMQERAALPIDREVLADSLLAQYADIGGAKGRVLDNIGALRSEGTFTVTTGHQLNIFTGPLYFIYKILHTIRLAEELARHYPGNRFVPVYWMATEDHDLDEIAFLNVFGRRFEWQTAQTGAVGRMTTEGLTELADSLAELFPGQERALDLIAVFRKAYEEGRTLAEATRSYTDALFGHYGLVIIDGDRPELKALFTDVMLRDALDNSPYSDVLATSRRLEEAGYPAQVNPREVNLFYLRDGVRERIVRAEGGFHALRTDFRWTEGSLADELRECPERFSPNVVLRPMYQERILPNLAYIGGAGELAYWLQLMDAFDRQSVSYPVLVLRNHLLLMDEGTVKRMDGLGLMPQDLFHPVDDLIRGHVIETVDTDLDLSGELGLLRRVYAGLKEKATEIDRTLVPALDAELTRQEKALEQWGGRFARSLKKKNETSVQQIQKLHGRLFPGGSLQERHDNILTFSASTDHDLITGLHGCMEPFGTDFGVVAL